MSGESTRPFSNFVNDRHFNVSREKYKSKSKRVTEQENNFKKIEKYSGKQIKV